jgi:hypothetical protein
MSNFDPTAFLNATITEATVKRPPLPAGAEFVATIKELKEPRQWTGKNDPTKKGVAVDLIIEIDMTAYPELQKYIGVDKVQIQTSIMLDTTEAGTLDTGPGKNGGLRRYREALGMNTPGQPFSFRMMEGRMIRVKIGHREYQGDLFDEIAAVAKA